MRQETLEEAAERHRHVLSIRNFVRGAKWQMERSYSEEEVKKIMALTWLKCSDNNAEDFLDNRNEILKQFK